MLRLFSWGPCAAVLMAGLAFSGPALALGGGNKVAVEDGGPEVVAPTPPEAPASDPAPESVPGATFEAAPATTPVREPGARLGGGKKPVDEGPGQAPAVTPAPDTATPAPTAQPAPPPNAAPESAETSPLVAACDHAAAHPNDPGKPVTVIGVDSGAMDIARAIEACLAAHQAFPDHGRTAYQLGRAYHIGNQPREAEAVYFEALADGYERASLAVGFLYQDDNALNRDAEDAFPFFRRAAEAGQVEAEFEMGWAYENGLGTVQDYAQAAQWYRRAADQGDKLAMNNLGWLYSEGNGVERDPVRAFELYRPGAEAGIAIAQYNLGWAYQNGVGVAQDQLAAAEWYGRAAANGETFAMLNLGYMYLFGEGVTRDPAEALSLFHAADDAGSIEAKSYIGEVYENATEYYHADTAAWYYVRALKGGDDWPTTRAAEDWDNATARAVQRILKDNGFYTGPLDGVMGAGSIAAMKRVLPAAVE